MADLRTLRDDLGAFARAVKRELTHWQLEALQLRVRTTVIVGSRQSGKSRSLSVLALWVAFRKSDQHILIISSGEDASKRLLSKIRRIIAESPILHASIVDEMSDLITLTMGPRSALCQPPNDRCEGGALTSSLLTRPLWSATT